MAIPHSQPGDVIEVRPLGAALADTRSHALIKSTDLEVIRVVLLAGQDMPPHATTGEITLQCLEGRVTLTCGGGLRELGAGQLILISGGDIHGLRAVNDASLLLTIALKSTSPRPNP